MYLEISRSWRTYNDDYYGNRKYSWKQKHYTYFVPIEISGRKISKLKVQGHGEDIDLNRYPGKGRSYWHRGKFTEESNYCGLIRLAVDCVVI